MDLKAIAAQAAALCADPSTNAHLGGGKAFWNPCATRFMYVPAFQFHALPGTKLYRYTAVDEQGNRYTFEDPDASALLTPIWADLPEGVTTLTVHALDAEGKEGAIVGARTFFKAAPFSDDLPAAACGYKEASAKAFRYMMKQGFITSWLTTGKPDTEYDLNVYPSKMIHAIVLAMLQYAEVVPEQAEDALTVARNAADYLIGLTPGPGSPVEGLPPTYQIDFRPNPETRNNATAADRLNTVMMLYPLDAGMAYLALEKKTGEKKYLDAALAVGRYFRAHTEENGSWILIRDYRTGEPLTQECINPLVDAVPFFEMLAERTGEDVWTALAAGGVRFAETQSLAQYTWGGQFEDSFASVNYSNLSHYGPSGLAKYYAKNFPDDKERRAVAEELVRFVEDQFVVWKRPAPWNKDGYDPSQWLTPCGLEQYLWYVPIDASTACIARTFLVLYKAGWGEIYLAKAMALADAITRAQRKDGMIPTHWMDQANLDGDNFWINCMIDAAMLLAEIAEVTEA